MRIAQHLAGGRDVGRMELRGAGKGLDRRVIAQDEVEHGSQKFRVGGRRPQRLRPDSRLGPEQAQPLGIAGNEAQRLNRKRFQLLRGGFEQAFSTGRFAFPLTYGLY